MTVRIALDGGTAGGASHVIPVLSLLGWYGAKNIDRWDGTSVGCVGAAAGATGSQEALVEAWYDVNGTKSFQSLRWPWQMLGKRPGVYSMDPLRAMLRKHLAKWDFKAECYAHAVRLDTKEIVAFPLHDMTFEAGIEAIIASCSQYPIHEAVWINGAPYGDGGLRHPLPYVRERYDEVWAVCCSPIGNPFQDNLVKPHDVGLMRPVEIVLDNLQVRDYALLKLLAQDARVYVVDPPRRYGQPFDASPETIRYRLESLGQQAWQRRRRVLPFKDMREVHRILGQHA